MGVLVDVDNFFWLGFTFFFLLNSRHGNFVFVYICSYDDDEKGIYTSVKFNFNYDYLLGLLVGYVSINILLMNYIKQFLFVLIVITTKTIANNAEFFIPNCRFKYLHVKTKDIHFFILISE